MVDKNHYSKYYEKIGENYNKLRLDAHNDMENVVNIIKAYVDKKATILDIGCGTGKYGELLEKENYKVIGIDKSEIQIIQAKSLIEAYVGDATFLPFPDASFDACTMIIMLQQLNDEERLKAFKEAYRVLKPHGILIIKTCSHEDLQVRFTAQFFPKTLEIDKKRYPDIPVLKDELAIFSQIETINSQITVKKEKERYIARFQERGASNLSFLSDEELEDGINNFKECFKDEDVIEKITKHTFIVARKED
ncbi:MAG: class I SAM-dependent methyltransferase [Bacilli bacterium]|nr:class I SAM-dependent methyltransferase [Bacilli bacterium]